MGFNIYEAVTNRFIEELEKGIIPWNKPWSGDGRAYNRITKKRYSLLNQMMLKHEGEYASYKQWQSIGGQVKKGAKSEIVVFWKPLQVAEENSKGEVETKIIPLLRYYNVFHISQVEGVEPLEKVDFETKKCDNIEAIIDDYATREGLKIENEELSGRAYYSPAMDYIKVPRIGQFEVAEEYYSTLFHEAVHSTGHPKRLGRFDLKNLSIFGSESYSKEELVTEIGAACILNQLGIETDKTFKNSAAYIQSWLKVLKNDSRLIVGAAGKAEKAVELILNTKAKDNADEDADKIPA